MVSQFTLYADVRRGRRPGFSAAAARRRSPSRSSSGSWRACAMPGENVATGRFGAAMEVELVNDGPFTLVLDSERDLAAARERSDLLGGPAAARAGLDADLPSVARHHHRLQVREPAAERALAVHADRLGFQPVIGLLPQISQTRAMAISIHE